MVLLDQIESEAFEKMIELTHGNLLKQDAEALVNTVNCVGVMGKGIALQFKQAFPGNFKVYKKACDRKEVQLGKVFVVPLESMYNPKYIINFPTKDHWKGKSRKSDILTGLESLVEEVKRLQIESIAVPPLGCGYGGLKWTDVESMIETALKKIPDVQVFLFEPKGAPKPGSMPVATKKPNMTRTRAFFIRLIEIYRESDYKLSLLEIQKLGYFLQVAGEPLKLDFQKDKYGPYTETLNHVLQRIEGHFIRGYGDRSSDAQIYLLPEASKQAADVLQNTSGSIDPLNRVQSLIEGFETPYGMELLASVHWITQEYPDIAQDIGKIIEKIPHSVYLLFLSHEIVNYFFWSLSVKIKAPAKAQIN